MSVLLLHLLSGAEPEKGSNYENICRRMMLMVETGHAADQYCTTYILYILF